MQNRTPRAKSQSKGTTATSNSDEMEDCTAQLETVVHDLQVVRQAVVQLQELLHRLQTEVDVLASLTERLANTEIESESEEEVSDLSSKLLEEELTQNL
jgi:predicted nuclease with TOPRIM domain